MNSTGAHGSASRSYELEEEAKYLDHELMDFLSQGKENKDWNDYSKRYRDHSQKSDSK